MEFKGTKQSEIYADGKSSSDVFKRAHITDFLAGYNKAIEDTSAPEMFEMFEMLQKVLKENHCTPDLDKEIQRLLTKITE